MKTLGILLHKLDDDLAHNLVQGLNSKVQQYGLRLVYFPGRYLHSPQLFNRQFNLVFDLACRVHLDGVLAITNAFQAGAYAEEIDQMLSLFQPAPLLSLNFVAGNNPSIIVDNQGGSEQLYRHLIYSHGYRRIAYMRGAEGHFDEEERFAAYLLALQKADIAFDPALVVQGNFDLEGGRRAMEELLSRKVRFDALVAANDVMAMAAMAVANEQHMHVPGDFAICGFDNFVANSGETPLFTTVAQPLALQAQMALELLLKQIEGQSIPLVTRVPLRLVVRQTCGCLGERIGYGAAPGAGTEVQGRANEHYREKIWAELDIPPERQSVYKSYLLFLEHCLRQVEKTSWMDVAIGEFARECLMSEGDVSSLQSLVFYLQRHLLDVYPALRLAPAPGFVLACAEQMQKWQIVITAKLRQFQLQKQLQQEREQHRLTYFVKTPVCDLSLASVIEAVAKTLNHLHIPQALLGLYPQSFDYLLFGVDMPAELRLVLQLRHGQLSPLVMDQQIAVADLFDSYLSELPGQSLVVLPLFQNSRHYGLLVLDISENLNAPLEWIRQEVTALVVGAILAEGLQKTEQHLEQTRHQNARLVQIAERDELTGLLNRRGFFHRAPLWLQHNSAHEVLLVFIGLDDLTMINDTYGHAEGDAALSLAAGLITQVFRSEDVICRLGGDEFMVMSAGVATHKGEQLRGRLYEKFIQFNQAGEKPYPLSCSLGFYPFDSRDTRSLEEVIQCADSILYEEKHKRKRERLN